MSPRYFPVLVALYLGTGFADFPLPVQAFPITMVAQSSSTSTTARDFVGRGIEKTRRGDFLGAIEDFDRAIQLAPDYAEAYLERGRVYDNLGEYRKAFADFERAIRLNPNQAEAYLSRGVASVQLNKIQEALADFDRAIRLNPNYDNAYFIRGFTYWQLLGETKKALADFDRAIRLNPNYAEAYYARSLIYVEFAKFEIALADLKKAAELFTKRNDVEQAQKLQANIGWLSIQSGQIEKGVSLLLDTPTAPSYRADFFFPISRQESERRKLYLETLDVFNRQLNGTTLVLAHIFIAHLAHERILDQDLFEQLQSLADRTRSPIYYDALRELASQQEDWDSVLKYAEAVLKRIEELKIDVTNPEHLSHFYYNSACGYSRKKIYDRAAEKLRQAFSIDQSLVSWSWKDPDLANLREYLGEEQFRRLVGEPAP